MEQYGIIFLGAVAQRAENSHKSEMINQLLFGEMVIIKKTQNGWANVIHEFDSYSGWVPIKQIKSLEEKDYIILQRCEKYTIENLIEKIEINQMQNLFIGAGSTIYKKHNQCLLCPDLVITNTIQLHKCQLQSATNLCEKAKQYLNIPYLWGGRSPFGMDCSGFVQTIFKQFGIALPRDASQQVNCGTIVAFNDEAKAGDLAFFENAEGNIIHVGILLSQHEIIHASDKVKIDKFDHNGIFCTETNKYTHKLRLIKRII